MEASVVTPPSPPRASYRGTIAILTVASLIAVTFLIAAAFPYFTLNQARFGPYWPRRNWLLLHIAGGMVALLTGPIQLWLGVSDRQMGVHRRLGVIYLASVCLSSIGAYYLRSIPIEDGYSAPGSAVSRPRGS